MAILEKIRSRSLFLILVIGLALFAFVISGVFTNDTGAGKSVVGEVNGESIAREDFALKVENASRRFGAGASTVQVVNQVWNQEVRSLILAQQFEELGISIEKDQILEVIKANPAFANDPNFLNEAGVFDEQKFVDFIYQLKTNNPGAYMQWQAQEDALISAAEESSYFNLIKAGVGSTLKEGELNYHIENDKVSIKYVEIPYTAIADTAVTVSESEIEAYVKAHENEFTQEASRSIRYVFFSEKASEEDITSIKEELTALKESREVYNEAAGAKETLPGFGEVEDVAAFVNEYSDVNFDSTYVVKNSIAAAVADDIFGLEEGAVYGPYEDQGYYKLTRMMDKKDNGSVKASHILISYDGAQAQAKEPRTKEEAKAKAEELLAEVKRNPEDFARLALENSEDPGSATRGGTYDNITPGQMVAPFNDFIFDNAIGAVGVVETDFGFHVIKVDDKYDAVQLATIARKIEASEKTLSDVFTETTKFEMAAGEGDFSEVAKASEYLVRPVNNLNAMDENIPGVGSQRSLVQWTFNPDTEVGDVRRFDTPDGYVVAQLTAKRKAGLARAKDAAPRVTPILKRQKKAAMIMEENAGKNMTELADVYGATVRTASDLTMKTPTIPGAGREPFVVGTALGMSEGDVSDMIEGQSGVYIIEVTAKSIAPSLDNYATYANTQKTLNRNRVFSAAYNALKDAAEIEDERADIY
ncbi:peptidylprolyl isomerase [Robertkochia marina]|uniref:Periplasmic chaperone PpiD n=1 Tax=Robertkochia marina TaxID=1227945 RepID=A0A4S3M3X2_9FLAO|nr:peptidylprolyl isomerase [Robertkochia marina]THD68847.1 peptidylprolyl isomerase [Robertkochia marina]TRZ43921.1 peptidylprolyl isomerase [Robertkochia marina]